MLKLEKIEAKDVYAIALVFLLAFGIWQFVPKSTLPEFEVAGMIRDSISGKAVPAYAMVAAQLEGTYAGFAGLAPQTPQALTGFLLILSPLLLAICAAALYLALRTLEYRKAESAFIAMLFSISLCCLAFLPGIFSSALLACTAFFAFFLCIAHYSKKGAVASLALAILLAAATGYFDASFAIAVVLVPAFFAYQKKKKDAATIAPFAAIAAAAIAAAALAGNFPALAFTVERLAVTFTAALPFIIGLASIPFALYFAGACEIEWMALALLGALLCGFSPLAGAAVLALPAAKGITLSMGDISKKARLAASFAPAFFAVFAISSQFFDVPQGLLASFLLACLAPITMHLYDYQNKAFFTVLCILILSSALFYACFYQLPPQKELYPGYLNQDFANALEYAAQTSPHSLLALSGADAVNFYLPSAELVGAKDTQDFLLNGSPKAPSGAYILLSPSMLSGLSENGEFELYSFATLYSSGSSEYAIFSNGNGRLVAKELGSDGKFILKDGAFIDNYGQTYANVPLSRMFFLSNKSYNETANRLVVLSEGVSPPYFLRIYGGSAGAALVNESGDVSIFRVG